MDYIRWLIKKVFGKDPIMILPCILLSSFVIAFTYMIHIIVGVVLTILAVSIWGTILYTFLADVFKDSYAKYQQEKNRGS